MVIYGYMNGILLYSCFTGSFAAFDRSLRGLIWAKATEMLHLGEVRNRWVELVGEATKI